MNLIVTKGECIVLSCSEYPNQGYDVIELSESDIENSSIAFLE